MTAWQAGNAPPDSALRVLLVCQPTTGGAARHVADLAEGLAKRGAAVVVACPPNGVLPARLRDTGIPVVDLPMQRDIHLLADLRSILELGKLCRELCPDVIHLHSSKAGFLGRLAGRLAGVPVVVFTPHCWSFQSAVGTKRDFYVVLERVASWFCDMTIAVSKREADEACDLRVVPRRKIRVIHNGLSAAELVPSEGARPEVPFVTVGRLEEQKGYRYLLDAMAELVHLEPEARLSIVGGGSLEKELRAQARRLGLTSTVKFEGEQENVQPYLKGSHIFVLSSLWEGLPYTILEAMAAGVPVITTDVGGCGELVDDGVSGLVVAPRDSHALSQAMRRLWTHSALRRTFGSAGAKRVRRDFRLDTCVEENEKTYLACLAAEEKAKDDERRAALLGPRGALILATIALVGLGAIGVDQLSYRGRILPGVKVGGAVVGGMSANDAAAKLATMSHSPLTVSLTATSDPITVFGPDVALGTSSALDQALLVGRVGALPRRIEERIAASRGGEDVALPAANTGAVASVLSDAQQTLDRSPTEARFVIVDGQVRVVDGKPGQRVDTDAFLTAVGRAATSMGSERHTKVPLVSVPPAVSDAVAQRFVDQVAQWTARPVVASMGARRLTLSPPQIASLLTVEKGALAVSGARVADLLQSAGMPTSPPKNAQFVVRKGKPQIQEGVWGSGPDIVGTTRSLQAALASGKGECEIAIARTEPDLTAKDLAALGITRTLSTFTTHFRLGMDNRDANIALSAKAIRGKVLGIGEVFSLNQATGPRNRATGYLESLVFMNGKVVPGIGGGVCQVSSTLYEAALFAGLGIVQRQSHSMAVSYLPPGRDATTYYPTIDLKFQNTTRGPILLWSEVKGDALTMTVYGSSQPQDIRVETAVKQSIAPSTKIVYDSSLPRNKREVDVVGTPGYVVTSYRLTYQGGVLLKRETLSTDQYQPKDWVIRVGT